jgi:hypothetical protein
MCALSLALTALSLLLLVLNIAYPDVPIYPYPVENTLLAVGYSIVGAVISPRTPQNPIGWLLCTIGLLWGVVHFTGEYAPYALLAVPGSLPAGEAAVWVTSWSWVPSVGLIVLAVLLFPDGRLLSNRWRWFAWLSALLMLIGAGWVAFSPGPIAAPSIIENPLGIESLPNGGNLVQALMFILLLVAVASPITRLRRSRGIERQQIKWPTYTGVVAASGNVVTYIISDALSLRWLGWVGYVLVIVGLIAFPISMGIAILRYRLYEIDRIINRTLVYGTVTAMLALMYFGSVLSLNQLFLALIGGQSPQLVIVATTLAIAAMFNPLRRRIQSLVDRRFYRRKYDAAKTLEAFSTKLRDETDLGALSEDLLAVVDETMQPAHLSLWLRPASRSKGEGHSPSEPRQ